MLQTMRMKLVRLDIFLILTAALFLLSGCGEEPTASAPAPSARKVQKPKPESEPISQQERVSTPEPPSYEYTPAGRRDPFQPYTAYKQSIREQTEPLTPLQRFEVNQLRLIAVIIGKGEPRAMIVAPDGKSYILKKGVKVGKQNGKVVEIRPEVVLVNEEYYDFSGEVRTSIKEIALPKRGGV